MFFDQGRMNLFAGDIDEIRGSPVKLGRLAQPADQIARSEPACLKRFRVLIREITVANVGTGNLDPIVWKPRYLHSIHRSSYKSGWRLQATFPVKHDSTTFGRAVEAMDTQLIAAIELLDCLGRKRCTGGNADADGAEAIAIIERTQCLKNGRCCWKYRCFRFLNMPINRPRKPVSRANKPVSLI